MPGAPDAGRATAKTTIAATPRKYLILSPRSFAVEVNLKNQSIPPHQNTEIPNEVKVVGTVQPLGWTTETVVLIPATNGVNRAVVLEAPAATVTEAGTDPATPGLLVSDTVSDAPPASACGTTGTFDALS
jgi:hypothetical protein